MMKSLRRSSTKWRTRLTRHIKDPAIDVVGVQLIASTIGRNVFYASMTSALFVSGFPLEAALMATLMLFDIVTTGQILHFLRRLMQYEVSTEMFEFSTA